MDEQERQQAVAGAVRAEMARARKRSSELKEVLGLSQPTIWGRMTGVYPFTVAELDKIAEFLGITAQGIFDSAALGEHLNRDRLASIPPFPDPPERDIWAQPPRAIAAQKRRAEGRRIGPH